MVELPKWFQIHVVPKSSFRKRFDICLMKFNMISKYQEHVHMGHIFLEFRANLILQ